MITIVLTAEILSRKSNIYNSILLLEELTVPPNQLPKPQIDYLMIGKNSLKYLPRISNVLEYKNLIFDATISTEKATSIIQNLEKPSNLSADKAEIHSISLNGAHVISI